VGLEEIEYYDRIMLFNGLKKSSTFIHVNITLRHMIVRVLSLVIWPCMHAVTGTSEKETLHGLTSIFCDMNACVSRNQLFYTWQDFTLYSLLFKSLLDKTRAHTICIYLHTDPGIDKLIVSLWLLFVTIWETILTVWCVNIHFVGQSK